MPSRSVLERFRWDGYMVRGEIIQEGICWSLCRASSNQMFGRSDFGYLRIVKKIGRMPSLWDCLEIQNSAWMLCGLIKLVWFGKPFLEAAMRDPRSKQRTGAESIRKQFKKRTITNHKQPRKRQKRFRNKPPPKSLNNHNEDKDRLKKQKHQIPWTTRKTEPFGKQTTNELTTKPSAANCKSRIPRTSCQTTSLTLTQALETDGNRWKLKENS